MSELDSAHSFAARRSCPLDLTYFYVHSALEAWNIYNNGVTYNNNWSKQDHDNL